MPANASKIAIRLLGYPNVSVSERPVSVRLKHILALIAILAEAQGPVARTKLAGLLWPDVDEETARARLRRLMHKLAQIIGESVLSVEGESVTLALDKVSVDSRTFRKLAEHGLSNGGFEELRQAVRLHENVFLSGFELASSQEFEDWTSGVRMELERLQLRALRILAEQDLDCGNWERALAAAEQLVALDPLKETSHCLVFRTLRGAGDLSALERAYRSCVETLHRELGVGPSEETEAVYRSLVSPKKTGAITVDIAAPPVRFAQTPSGSIAYAVVGEGAPVVIIPGFISHIEIAWEEPRLRAFLTRLSHTNQVIMFDRRGLGLSERVGITPTIEAGASDIEAILDAERIKRAVLFGASEGGPIAIRLAVSKPERVAGLVLFGTLACGSWREDYPWALKEETFRGWSKYVLSTWGAAMAIEAFAPSVAMHKASEAWWARTLRTAATPAAAAEVLNAFFRIDVRKDLPHVHAPTVVLHRRGDLIVRFGAGEHLARNILGARLVAMEGVDHWWWIGDCEPILNAIAEVTRSGHGNRQSVGPDQR
jgi:DNA-binding SARP family transcriptional activator